MKNEITPEEFEKILIDNSVNSNEPTVEEWFESMSIEYYNQIKK